MEIKIGILNSNKEVVLDSDESQDAIQGKLAEATNTGSALRLTEASGRLVLVPVANIAYLDLSTINPRPVGFGTMTS